MSMVLTLVSKSDSFALDLLWPVGVTGARIKVFLVLTGTLHRDLIFSCCSAIASANLVATFWQSSCFSFAASYWCSFGCWTQSVWISATAFVDSKMLITLNCFAKNVTVCAYAFYKGVCSCHSIMTGRSKILRAQTSTIRCCFLLTSNIVMLSFSNVAYSLSRRNTNVVMCVLLSHPLL